MWKKLKKSWLKKFEIDKTMQQDYYTKLSGQSNAPASHRRRGSIPAGGPYSWWIFLNSSRLEFRHVYNFHSILRHINPLENGFH